MELTPTLIYGLNGEPLTPVIKADLEPLAKEATLQTVAKEATLQAVAKEATLQTIGKDATLQAIVTALQALPKSSTKIHRVTIGLAAALNDAVVGLGTLTHVQAITVADLTGAVIPTLKMNGIAEIAFPLAKGEMRDNLDATTLHVTCAAGGGNIVLELHGR